MAEFMIGPQGPEDALWDLLDRMLRDPATGGDVTAIRLDGWNPELLYFPEEERGHSVRPTLARAIMDYHASLSKAYALVVYGQANRQLLRREDKEALDLLFLVTDGSNGLEAFGKAIDELTKQMVAKLSGRQVMGIILVIVLLFFGTSAVKEYYSEQMRIKEEQIESEERIELSRQETERTRMLTEAMEKFGIDPLLKEEANEGTRALTRPAAEEDHSRVRGVDLNKRQARAILSGEEKAKEGKRLDGEYRVVDINTETDSGYIVKLQNVDTDEEITAHANYDELTNEDIHTIFDVAERKTVLRALVNAFFVGERITRASIVRAYTENGDDRGSSDETDSDGEG